MKKLTFALAAAGLLSVGTIVHAGSFDGFYVGGGLTLNKVTVENTYSYNENYYGDLYSQSEKSTAGDNGHSAGLNLNLGYGMSFGQFNLAGELSYQPRMGEAKPYSYGYSYDGYSYNESATFKLTKGVAISILPGYKIGNNTLVYGRLGYVRATAKSSYSESDNQGYSYSESGSAKVKGILYGVGMKHAFTPQLSAVLEYQAVDFKKKTVYSDSYDSGDGYTWTESETIKPSASGVLMGIQYNF